jgi:signal transduction histidine kinase
MVRGEPAPEPHQRIVRLCHDLRQYLAASLNLAEMPDDAGAGASDRFRLIAEQLRLANELIAAELRDERHQLVDLVELVDECVRTVRLTHEVEVTVKAGQSTFAYGDPVQIRQAILNVLDNAGRATGKTGAVDVTIDSQDGLAWIQVTDDGQGFGHAGAGLGQGLAIISDAVRANHGRLEILSGPEPGTTVRMLWPQRAKG